MASLWRTDAITITTTIDADVLVYIGIIVFIEGNLNGFQYSIPILAYFCPVLG